MKKLTFLLIIILAAAFPAFAQNTECIVTDYFATEGTAGANSNENYDKLLDDNRNTKWCVTNLGNPTFVEFHHGSPFIPTGYILTTGNDNATNHGRNPKDWVIKAKLNPNDDWTTIATVTNDNMLQDVNNTDFEFTINNSNQYKYFRFEVSAVQSGSKFQLGEFRFKGEGVMNTDPIIAGFTAYNGQSDYDYQPVVDNDRWTYWHVPNWNKCFWVDFFSDQAFIPTGYILTSTPEFGHFLNCNPRTWRIDAKMNFEDEWETIAQVNVPMPNYTKTDFEYTINNNNNKAYRYFHFEVHESNYSEGDILRLAELRFRGQVVDDYVYIKDLKLIGGTKDEVNNLIESYGKQGWKCIDYDLNKGCGNNSDWIYLLFKDEYSEGQENKGFVSDFYLWTQNADALDTRTYNGRIYQLVPYDGGDHFKNVKGDLNSHAGGSDIHLYYTKEAFPDRRSVDGIVFNNTQSGALGSGGGSTGYDLNTGAHGDYIYMHFTTSPTTGVMPQGTVNECVAGYGSIFISGTAYDADHLSTSLPLQACLYEDDGITLYRRRSFLADRPNNGFAYTLKSITPGVYHLKLFGTDLDGNGDIQIGETQTVTVTEGPETIGIGHGDETNLYPVSAYTQYQLTQQIYSAGEIQSAGTITGVAFYFDPYPGFSAFSMSDVQIYMQHIDKEYFLNDEDIVPVDLNCKVFEGTIVAENTGWAVFDLGTPFEYDGIHNILLSFNDPTEVNYPGEGFLYRFRVQSGSHNSLCRFVSSTNPIEFDNLANHPYRFYSSARNDIQFHIIPSGCPRPVNLRLDQCTLSEATVVWDAPETTQGINGYTYQFKRGDEPWIDGQTSSRTVSFGNLVSNTDYRFRVKTRYNNGDESVFSEIKFKTPVTLPYENGFEFDYDEMSVFSIDWSHGGIKDENSYSGNKSFKFTSTSPQYLISPCFSNTDEIVLSFYYRASTSFTETFQVGYSTSDKNVDSFTWIDTVAESTAFWSKYWHLYSRTFPVGTRYIAIKYVTSEIRGLYIDDFYAEKLSSYPKPENLTASVLTTNRATITWTAPSGETPVGYAYQYMKSSTGRWTVDMGFVESNSVSIYEREPNTEYDIRVKALYANGQSSNFVRYRFMTEAEPYILPIQEGFENDMGGWRVVNGKIYTEIYPFTGAHTGLRAFRFDNEGEEDQYLFSPKFISDDNVYLSFFYKTYKSGNEHFLASFYVGYSTTTKDLDAFTWSENLYGYGDWREYSAQYPPGTKYIAVKWSKSLAKGLDSYMLYLDDFSIWTVMSHSVAGASNWNDPSRPIDGWNFIASPVEGSIEPTSVKNLIYSVNNVPSASSERYDLYRLNNTTWENYKVHTDFVFENGKGYLYAIYDGANLEFTGQPCEGNTKAVALSHGFNLVGNPFYTDAYIDRPYFRMNDARTDIVAVSDYINTPIPRCTGVVVTADSDTDTVTFTKALPATMPNNNGSLQITLMKADSRDDVIQDKAIVSFNDDTKLGKFVFNERHSQLYIPQGGKDYAIANAEGQNEIPLNFKAAKNGEYTLSFNLDGVESDYLHLIDNLTGADIDLLAPAVPELVEGHAGDGASTLRQVQGSAPSYTFTAKTTDYPSRFKLVFSAASTGSAADEAFAYIDASGNIIVTADARGASLQVIDVMGRVLVCRDASNASAISTTRIPAGVYVLRLIDGDTVRTQKMVVE